MKIIILGAGRVGSSVANILASENNAITMVDKDQRLLAELSDQMDIKTIVGHASHPRVLRRAGAADADMLIAVTQSDEVNMVACQVAYTLFHVPTKIARVRSEQYTNKQEQLFSQDALPVDVLISPEQIMMKYIRRLIEYHGALQVLDFAGGRVQMVAVQADSGSPLVGQPLRALKAHMPDTDVRVVAIYRQGTAIFPHGDTIIQSGDDVFFLSATQNVRRVMKELRQADKAVKRVMLAGGGNIGRLLAKKLEAKYQVKVIEHNRSKVRTITESLSKGLVLEGDAADEDLLKEENIDAMDVFCALTNDDEANILSAMLAKRMGCSRVMSIINRSAYVDLVESEVIDIAISPRQVTIGTLLAHVRRGDVVAVHSLRRGAAEAIEAVAHGDERTSKVVGRRLKDLKLPEGTTIGAVVRGESVMMFSGDIEIQPDDHVILFLADKRKLPEVERLFAVSVGFI
ncbi:TrkA-N domain protein [gamma proteobacterium HTCC5015]|nr:TrkA-N domain protein [gamma proteobacterium HTCC5015]